MINFFKLDLHNVNVLLYLFLTMMAILLNIINHESVNAVSNWAPEKVDVSIETKAKFDNSVDYFAKCKMKKIRVGLNREESTQCVTEGEGLRYSANGDMISAGNDSPFYSGSLYVSSLYKSIIPSTDKFVWYDAYPAESNSSPLRIIDDFGNRITYKTIYSNGQAYKSYIADTSNPDFEFTYGNGMPWKIGKGMGFSPNGRWLVAEVVGTGFVRIDLENFAVKRFTADQVGYWWGHYPTTKIDISNDGTMVALGNNIDSGMKVYEIDDSCGDTLSSTFIGSDTPLSKPCIAFDLHDRILNKVGNEYRAIYEISISADKQEVRYLAKHDMSLHEDTWVSLRTPYYDSRTVTSYLALGDSYSSGEGDTEIDKSNKKYYRFGTDIIKTDLNPKEKCHISTRSYPYVLASGMSLGNPIGSALTKWQSVACAGATIWDVKEQASQLYEGQGKRLIGFDQDELKTAALNEFIPGRQKQIEFVKKYKPQAITLTMGGNDIGFGDKMKSCALSLGTCDVATKDGAPRFAKQIQDQYDSLRSLYEELFEASGGATKIYVIGYPQFINGNQNDSCSDTNLGMINSDERKMISKSITYLNNVIKQATEAAGAKYLDIENSLQGHKLCDSGKKYVTGIALRPPSEPQESFHPNAKGHYEMAMSIWGRVNNQSLLDFKWCEENEKNCPKQTATKEQITEVESYAVSNDAKRTVYKNLTSSALVKGKMSTVTLEKYSITPNTLTSVSLRESGVVIGQSVSKADGSLDVSVEVPPKVLPGNQTIVIDSNTYSGEPIELEQVVEVNGPNSNDVDEDGVVDANDKCLFVTPSNKDFDQDGVDDACDPEIGETPNIPSPTPSTSPSPSPSPTPNPGSGNGSTNPVVAVVVSILKKVATAIAKLLLKVVSLFIK